MANMKELNFAFEEQKIKINGKEYKILQDDGDILKAMIEYQAKFTAVRDRYAADPASVSGEELEGSIFEIRDYVDSMLGAGAMREITGGKKVGLAKAIRTMQQIGEAIVATFAENADDEFGLEDDDEFSLEDDAAVAADDAAAAQPAKPATPKKAKKAAK